MRRVGWKDYKRANARQNEEIRASCELKGREPGGQSCTWGTSEVEVGAASNAPPTFGQHHKKQNAAKRALRKERFFLPSFERLLFLC
jgi:hypothetical protein